MTVNTRKFEAHFPSAFRKIEKKILWTLPKKFGMAAKFEANNEGFKVTAINPEYTMYLELKFRKAFFTQLIGDAVFELRSGYPSFKLNRKCEEVIWYVDSKFHCQLKGNNHLPTYSAPFWHPSVKTLNLSTLKMDVTFCAETTRLHNIFNDIIKIDKKTEARITCNNISKDVKIEYGDRDGITHYEDYWNPDKKKGEYLVTSPTQVSGEYSLYDLNQFFASVYEFFPTMTVAYSRNHPLSIKGIISSGADLVDIQAYFSPW
jgi:hypothetical protein